jgi:poly[(R)-3-hydroxyalkanoate] polymerase subunit PhaC
MTGGIKSQFARRMSKSKHIAALAMPTTDSALVAANDRDSYTVSAFAEVADRSLHAALARLTGGLSPAALAHAFSDWAMHLAYAPGKQMQLVDKAIRKTTRLEATSIVA